MRTFVFLSVLLSTLNPGHTAKRRHQQAVAQDPQAISVFQQAVTTMGKAVPSDSTATGTISTEAGSLAEQGTVLIQTRGINQSSVQAQTPHGRTVVYSQGQGSYAANSAVSPISTELALSSQAAEFPLPILAAALNNSDTAFKYVGLESVNGASAHHIQFWNSYASATGSQGLSGFTYKDAWIDATSYLPVRLSYVQRVAGGSEPRIPVDYFYSNYQNVSGVLYPYLINRSFNGTPSETITIQQVAFNTGLTDSNFPVQ
jgi:hypothetical protein